MSPAFDYVVVGGGSAGCVLANRLSERASVLLVEAGAAQPVSAVGYPALLLDDMSSVDWAYTSVAQSGLLGRTSPVTHGRVLGGTSVINGLLYLRGDPSDYDGWGASGATGWNSSEMQPYFRRVEDCVDVDDPWLGHGGPFRLEHLGAHNPHPATAQFLTAAEALGHRIVPTFEGPGGLEGVGFFHANINQGRRTSVLESYLQPAVGRPTLTVWTDTRVLRLNFDGIRCTGVQLRRGGEIVDVVAGREVVVTASALESPKLLMLSGIGDPALLSGAGINPRVSLPGVGANLHDHIMVILDFPGEELVGTPYFLTETAIFHRSSPAEPSPDLETIFVPRSIGPGRFGEMAPGFALICVVIRPSSTGSLLVRNADPNAAPIIDPGYLADARDVDRLVAAIKHALALAAGLTPAGPPLGGAGALLGSLSDAGLADWVRANAVTHNHIAGSCRMGTDDLAVVDPELRVHGTEGLRVADVSVQPRVVSGHCQGAVLAIAERAADLILGSEPPPAVGARGATATLMNRTER